jgi:hypothetical protein
MDLDARASCVEDLLYDAGHSTREGQKHHQGMQKEC